MIRRPKFHSNFFFPRVYTISCSGHTPGGVRGKGHFIKPYGEREKTLIDSEKSEHQPNPPCPPIYHTRKKKFFALRLRNRLPIAQYLDRKSHRPHPTDGWVNKLRRHLYQDTISPSPYIAVWRNTYKAGPKFLTAPTKRKHGRPEGGGFPSCPI